MYKSINEKTGQNHWSPKKGDVKNASNGGNAASKGGTTREFGNAKPGNNFGRPVAHNNASKGQTDGHNMGRPAQTRSYPNKSVSKDKYYCGKAGDAKNASNGEGPNSRGGTTRTFPK